VSTPFLKELGYRLADAGTFAEQNGADRMTWPVFLRTLGMIVAYEAPTGEQVGAMFVAAMNAYRSPGTAGLTRTRRATPDRDSPFTGPKLVPFPHAEGGK
jgi:hypothetical protein